MVAIDKNTSCLKDLKKTNRMVIKANIETKNPILETKKLSSCSFDVIIVINYLHRPLFNNFFNALAPGGLIIYETFAEGNEYLGHPKNPEYLLKNNELLDLTHKNFNVIAYENGIIEKNTSSSVIQRICAIKQNNISRQKFDEKTLKKIYP